MSHLTPYLAVFAVSSKKWITSCQVDSFRQGLHTKKREYVSGSVRCGLKLQAYTWKTVVQRCEQHVYYKLTNKRPTNTSFIDKQ